MDGAVGGSGLDLGYARYNGGFVSQAAAFWGFYAPNRLPHGENWVHNFHYFILRVDATTAVIYYKKGKILFFEKVGPAWQFNPFLFGFTYAGTPYQMVEAGTKLELMDPANQQVLAFEFATLADFEIGGVERIRDRNGNAHTLTYNPDGTLALVEDGLGRSLACQYAATAGGPRVSRVTDQSGRFIGFGYDAVGLVTEATDARGGVTRYAYDANRQLVSVTEPEGNVVVQNAYDGGFRVVSQTDGEGNVHAFAYGPGATTISDPLGNTRTHHFDGAFRMTGFTDEAGSSIQYAYDGSHRLVSTTDRMGDGSTITYHAPSGYVASRTDNLGQTWTYTYSPQLQEGFTFHDLARIDYPDGTAVVMTRDARGNVTSVTDREGNTTLFTYNARGQVATSTNAAGGVTAYTYNADATVASREDPSGNLTTYDYDAQKRLVAVHRPDASMVTFAYDGNDNVVSATDENGNTTTYTYDANDNLRTAADPLGQTTTLAYDGNNDLVSVTDPLGQTTAYARDGLRRVASRTDRAGNTVSYAYDARRRLVAVTDELGQVWSFAYDGEGVVASVTDPLGQTYGVTSDALGRVTRIHDPLGNETAYVYDALSRLVQMTDPLGQTTSYERDANGLVARISLAEPGISASYARSSLLRIETVTDPRGFAWDANYDQQARRISRTDPLGNLFTYAYDSRNRVAQTTLPGGLGTIGYTYDAAGRRTQWSASDGTTFTYAYDADDRLTAATGVTMAYDSRDQMTTCNGLAMTYDADGRLASITFEPGKTVTYAYDARDQLAAVTDWAGGVTTFTHDDEGRLTTIAHPNGVTTSTTYDAADRLLGIAESDTTREVLSSIALVRDGDGQITQAIRDTPLQAAPEPGSAAFAYDAANQDEAGTFDALGRLLDDGTRTFSWNLADQLTGYTQGAATVTFTRDAFGNVLARTDSAGTRELVWNYALGLPSIAVEKEGGAALRYYIHTPGGRLLYSLGAADGARLTYHYDEVGSTIFLTDGAGQAVQSYAYSPYGEVLAEAGTVDNRFAWHGMFGVVRDGDLYSMRARYYDPARGRFASRDPIQLLDPKSANPYQALFQNPLAFVDPRGTDPEGAGSGGIPQVIRDVIDFLFGPSHVGDRVDADIQRMIRKGGTDARNEEYQRRRERERAEAQESEAERRRDPNGRRYTETVERGIEDPPPARLEVERSVFDAIQRVQRAADQRRFEGERGVLDAVPRVLEAIQRAVEHATRPSDLREAPRISMDSFPAGDVYVFIAPGRDGFLPLELVPLGPGNVRAAEQDPDLSRRSFDPRRMSDLPEIIR